MEKLNVTGVIMPMRNPTRRKLCVGLLAISLCGCFSPPYNNFKEDKSPARRAVTGTAIGIGLGTAVGALGGYPLVGAAIGGASGIIRASYQTSKKALLINIQKAGIQYVEYGDTMTLIIPTDKYFVFDTPQIDDLCYAGLEDIIKLLKYYACSPIYVAAFTDDVGSRHHKKMLSQGRAEAMLTFLWANGIKAQRLHAEGYGDKYDIGDNHLIHGSAYNRRIEIQWFRAPVSNPPPMPYG